MEQSTCHVTGKTCHGTEGAALKCKRHLGPQAKDKTLQPYKCRHCGKWHLGHNFNHIRGLLSRAASSNTAVLEMMR